jgi:hypothetical protein
MLDSYFGREEELKDCDSSGGLQVYVSTETLILSSFDESVKMRFELYIMQIDRR